MLYSRRVRPGREADFETWAHGIVAAARQFPGHLGASVQQLTGLETWFKLPGSNVPTMKPPPRWKMWLVSLVAVYPLVLAFQALLVPKMTRLPLALRALLFPLVLLSLMTFVVMPMVTRLLRRWLGPRQDEGPVDRER